LPAVLNGLEGYERPLKTTPIDRENLLIVTVGFGQLLLDLSLELTPRHERRLLPGESPLGSIGHAKPHA
jgi:hypothetical protein